jgi:hypothetical protein
MGDKMHLVLFGDSMNYCHQRERLEREARESGWFETIESLSESDLNEFLEDRSEFVASNPRGFGLYVWKPHVISQALSRIPEGDILVYLDAAGRLLRHRFYRIAEYRRVMQSSKVPVLVFSVGQTELGFTKKSLLERLGLENDQGFLESGQGESGTILCVNTPAARDFVSEWMSICTEDGHTHLMDSDGTNELEGFVEHRHDQSVLSALCKLRGAAVMPSECYGVGPFFMARVSDHGPRPHAPDTFRMDPSYIPDKHPTWASYLDDPETLLVAVQDAREGIRMIHSGLPWGRDNLQSDFQNKVEDILSKMQYTKGLWRVELSTDEPDQNERTSRETITGRFSVSTRADKSAHLFFKADRNEIIFQDYKLFSRYLYKKEWSRQWDLTDP